jgi:hypothetical protein
MAPAGVSGVLTLLNSTRPAKVAPLYAAWKPATIFAL